MIEADFQALSTVQGALGPKPRTVATAATIAPTGFLTYVTGTAATLATITPPVAGVHMLCFIFSVGAVLNVTGNILNAATAVSGSPTLLIYDPLIAKYVALV